MKKIDELKAALETAKTEAQTFLNENKVADAKAKMEEVKELKASIEIQEVLDAEAMEEVQNKIDNKKVDVTEMENVKQSANTVRAMIKAGMGKSLTQAENALLIPASGAGTDGVGYLLPSDVRTMIVEKIRQYKSFRDVLGYIPTTTLTGSFPVEDFETLSELVDFTDGTDGTEPTDIKFKNVTYALKEKGAIIKLSNTLLQMTDNNLIAYIANVFAKKAVITENKMAITALQTGKTLKQVADWKALKKSINVDLDEGVKYGTVVVVNQDGFDVLDSALDTTGRPVLQPNPANPTQKLFMGYPVHVFSNALLPTTGTTTKKAPLFYGNLTEAVSFVDNGVYAFASSEHAGFTSNTTIARVIEYVDVTKVDASDKIYIAGEFTV
ncbi:phage major capsid protein [Paenibacillus sp. Root444D2]|uniref:phage major capsid protein n=1 Tax=Paenibacillus sp. Root444D2 TaxID=1736538 RepID=UPI00071094E1|nr:phage major capsid protein [Paenibacillus sp. Root444D2]KQX69235.1 hypothetical protein ASD40_01675 [Paenibacillus sp. Root444D2]